MWGRPQGAGVQLGHTQGVGTTECEDWLLRMPGVGVACGGHAHIEWVWHVGGDIEWEWHVEGHTLC